jgi:hypothetical protein
MSMTMAEVVPAGEVTERESSIRFLCVSEIRRDETVNTRPPNETWITKRLGGNFSAMKLGILTVSERRADDGGSVYIVIDGQNRCELVRRQQGADAKVKCEIFRDLTTKEEARMFLGLNDDRPPNATSKFKARVTAGDIAAMKIMAVITEHGYQVDTERGCGVLACIRQLEIIFNRDVQKRGTQPALALERTLATINAAWRPNDKARWATYGDATHMSVIAGIGKLYYLYNNNVDVQRMIERLEHFPGGPESLLHRANGLTGAKSLRTIADGVVEVVLGEYNRGLKKNVLPLP